MKFKITFKDPDGVFESLKDIGITQGEEPPEVAFELSKFLTWGECITVEFDTETGEARVVPKTERY